MTAAHAPTRCSVLRPIIACQLVAIRRQASGRIRRAWSDDASPFPLTVLLLLSFSLPSLSYRVYNAATYLDEMRDRFQPFSLRARTQHRHLATAPHPLTATHTCLGRNNHEHLERHAQPTARALRSLILQTLFFRATTNI